MSSPPRVSNARSDAEKAPAPPGRAWAARGLRVAGAAALLLALSRLDAGAAASNVTWSFRDSLAVCPAGDSVAAGRPARLRIEVAYSQLAGGVPVPRAGAPPESVWVTWAPLSGTARVNDQPGLAFADDSTDAAGRTRITAPSLSGAGTLALTLWVAGEAQGSATVLLRGTDSDLDGRATASDAAPDLDYDGDVDAADAALAAGHLGHTHRQVMFGAMERRTSLTNPEFPIGESTLSWSPGGHEIAFTIHTEPYSDCAVFRVVSDPAGGDTPVPFTFPDEGVHDYDPSWSPLGTEIAFGRNDNAIFVKGVPGLSADTSLRLVTRHNDGTALERGDLMPAFSPEGLWVAFSRKSTGAGHYEIWKTPADGDTTRRVQLTFDSAGDDFYAQWSSDGEWIVYQRRLGADYGVWKVPAAGGAPVAVIDAGGGLWASAPAFAPDGAVILAGIGPPAAISTYAFDASLSGLTLPDPRLIASFPDLTRAGVYPGVSPRLSPDGTRLAVSAGDVWAARRNMSLPPVLTSVAGQAIDDHRPFVDIAAAVGSPVSFQVTASDPEGDTLDYHAGFLGGGMSFDPGARTFSWLPPATAAGTSSNVRFEVTTPSGGCDYAIARITVLGSAGVPTPAPAARFAVAPNLPNPFAGSTSIRFELPAPDAVRVEVFDLGGRRLRVLADQRLEAGPHALEWDGRDAAGRRAPPGLYLCRVSSGPWRGERKLLKLEN